MRTLGGVIGIEPWFKQYDGPDSLVDYVISKNLRRRHLEPSQTAQIFAALCKYRPGGDVTNPSRDGLTAAKAAIANVSEKTMERAMLVDRRGDEKLKNAVISGSITVNEAQAVTKILPEKDQQAKVLS